MLRYIDLLKYKVAGEKVVLVTGELRLLNSILEPSLNDTVSTMVCKIRCHRGLTSGFGIKDKMITYMPCMLKLSFKDIIDKDEEVVSLVIHATPIFSAFKSKCILLSIFKEVTS